MAFEYAGILMEWVSEQARIKFTHPDTQIPVVMTTAALDEKENEYLKEYVLLQMIGSEPVGRAVRKGHKKDSNGRVLNLEGQVYQNNGDQIAYETETFYGSIIKAASAPKKGRKKKADETPEE